MWNGLVATSVYLIALVFVRDIKGISSITN